MHLHNATQHNTTQGEDGENPFGSDATLHAAVALANARKHITQLRRAREATCLAVKTLRQLEASYAQVGVFMFWGVTALACCMCVCVCVCVCVCTYSLVHITRLHFYC